MADVLNGGQAGAKICARHIDEPRTAPHNIAMTQNTPEIFTGSFTQQEPIPEDGIEAAIAVMRSGRLHRYNVVAKEEGEVALLEQEFAAAMGVKYCLAVASGGYAMTTALRALGVRPGDCRCRRNSGVRGRDRGADHRSG